MIMLSNVFLEKFFANNKIQKVPIGLQSDIVNAIEEVLEELQEEKHFSQIAQLFSGGGKVTSKKKPSVKEGDANNG